MVLLVIAHVISACGLNTLHPTEKITEGIFMTSSTFHYSGNQGGDGSALGWGRHCIALAGLFKTVIPLAELGRQCLVWVLTPGSGNSQQ